MEKSNVLMELQDLSPEKIIVTMFHIYIYSTSKKFGHTVSVM